LAFVAGKGENYYHTNIENGFNADFAQLCFITQEDFRKVTGKETNLEENEILFFSDTMKDKENIRIETGDYTFDFTIVEHLKSFPSVGNLTAIVDTGYAVVKDEQVLRALYKGQKSAYGEKASGLEWVAIIDTDLKEDDQIKCAREIGNLSQEDVMGDYKGLLVNTRAENSADFYATSGGFLFLGLFLGFLFNMATVLIIYYKQISEGYEDKARFEIMQKVGLPKKEIRCSVSMQILIVFFAPLAVAAIHVAFDFKLMVKLLSLFYLTDNRLTMLCTFGTLLGFAVIYGIVYWLTARTYYKIVSA
jgi:putative ABC transport system permease protein